MQHRKSRQRGWQLVVSSGYGWYRGSFLRFGFSLIFGFGLTILSILVFILRFSPLKDSGDCLLCLAGSDGDALPGLLTGAGDCTGCCACAFGYAPSRPDSEVASFGCSGGNPTAGLFTCPYNCTTGRVRAFGYTSSRPSSEVTDFVCPGCDPPSNSTGPGRQLGDSPPTCGQG